MRCQLAAIIDARNLEVSRTGKGARLTQRKLARDADVALSTVSRLCTNSGKGVEFDVIGKLCDTLGCTPGDLFVLQEDAPDEA